MNIKGFKKTKLLPAIVQELQTNEILMQGYMNNESFKKTLQTRKAWFWSRSRKKLWMKGMASGNELEVKEIYLDCDEDAILLKVKMVGDTTCHLGTKSCFKQIKF